MGQKFYTPLKADRCQCVANTRATVIGHLKLGDLKERWRTIKEWYTSATDRPPKPCFKVMAKQTADRDELYRKVPPPGDSIPCNIESSDVDNVKHGNVELQEVMSGMCNGCVGGQVE